MRLLTIGFARYRMIHTYRDMNAPGGRSLAVAAAGMAVLFPVAAIASFAFAGPGFAFTWSEVFILAPFVVVPPVFLFLVYRHDSRVSCNEIRLDDHGTCELETRHRVIRLHVNEITAVKYRRDPEGGTGSYVIRYAGGKLYVSEKMTNFSDFLARLRAANPAVSVTDVPADLLARRARREESRSFTTSVLFPLLFVGLLVWLSLETLLG